jgi:hypothetical protein
VNLVLQTAFFDFFTNSLRGFRRAVLGAASAIANEQMFFNFS